MDTTAIQRALVALGYSLIVDGKPGPKTTAAVQAFQRAVGLYPDGIAGPKMSKAFQAAKPGPPSPPAPPRQSMSAIGLEALIGREARKLKAYLDSVGVWTIGIGHTAAAGAPSLQRRHEAAPLRPLLGGCSNPVSSARPR